jgi:hypothetical protein
MSKGLGKVEKQILEVLNEHGGNYSMIGIYFDIMMREHKNPIKYKKRRAKYNSIQRAVESLKRKCYVSTRKLSRKEYDSYYEENKKGKKKGIYFHPWYTDATVKPPTWCLLVELK